MSIADGIRMGMGLINDSQATKAREEELKAWREEREDKKARNLALDTNMEQTLAALGKTEDTVSPFLNQQGLAPMSTYYEGQQGAYNRRQGFGAAPDDVTQAEPINLPKRDNMLTMGQLQALKAARDTAGFYTVANQDKKDQLAHGAAQIQRYVANNATPDQIKAFSDKYTAEARIPGKMKFDPASGMTTIDLDSGESVKLDRQQFGGYLAGLYRQEQGDTTAAADIAGIHKALGAQADKMYGYQRDATKDARDERRIAVAERAQAANERKIDALLYGAGRGGSGGGGRSGGGSGSSGAGQQAGFNPLGSFDSKKAQAVAFEQAAAAADEKGKPLTPPAQGQLAQKIYRSMEDAFATENAARERARLFKELSKSARTQDEVNSVRERARKSGYTDAEMAALDPRFATTTQPPSDTPMQDFLRMSDKQLAITARKPRGVSSAEAAQAQAEIDKRRSGPPTLKAW